MAWFDTGEAMGTLNALGRDANNFIKRTIEEIERDLSRLEVNVGVPGVRFGQSRNQRGSSEAAEGGLVESEMRSLPKKVCEGCTAKFSVWKRKKECTACKRMFCNQCLPKAVGSGANSGVWCARERRQATCNRCSVLLAQPPSRPAIQGLRTRDLQAFLACQGIPTQGCLEKDDLVNLVMRMSRDGSGQNPPQDQPEVFNHHPSGAESDGSWRLDDSEKLGTSYESRCEGALRRERGLADEVGSRNDTLAGGQQYAPPDAQHRLYPGLPSEETSHLATNIQTSRRRNSSSSEGEWEIVEPDDISQNSAPRLPSEPIATTSGTSDMHTSSLPRSDNEIVASPPTPPSVPEASVSVSSDSAGASSSLPQASSSSPSHVTEDIASSSQEASSQGITIGIFDNASAEPESSSANLQPSAPVSSANASPSKLPSYPQAPRDIASSILSSANSIDDLANLSVKQLKELLTSSRVNYHGCCEKQELLERAQRLWREYKAAASQENLNDDSICKVCMDAPIDCVMLECGHMATCTLCGKRMNECPICRQYVVRIVRIFKA